MATARAFGLECPERVEWKGWRPGGEYIKTITIKNVSPKTVKFKCSQPTSKAFSMEFSECIMLSAGMHYHLKVVFRPPSMEAVEDVIEIFSPAGGSLSVHLAATLPTTQLQLPPALDFGFVPTKEVASIVFQVKNVGDTKVGFKWKLQEPFSIQPPSMQILPGQTLQAEAFFRPIEASAFNGSAVCELDNGAVSATRVSGIAKYPFLSLEHSSLDFGSVLVGKTVERSIRFGNHSAVAANFTVAHASGNDDGVFKISPESGSLGPDEYSVLTISYRPRHTSTFSCENFTVSTAGGNRLTLNLHGHAVGPVVTLSTRCFNFGSLLVNQAASRVLYLENQSDVPAMFEMNSDALEVFSLSRTHGVIPPQSTMHMTISFKAAVPANYWLRVACIIKDADPIAIDLLATTYDAKSRPPPLHPRHINSYYARIAAGQPAIPPAAASATLTLPAAPSPPPTAPPPDLPLDPPATAGPVLDLPGPDAWDLYFAGQDPAACLSLDTDLLDFGTCSRLSSSEYKSVTITNHTDAKLLAFVAVPGWQDPGGGGALPPVFQVVPEQVELKPQGQAVVRVAFRPPLDGQFYCQPLRLVAYVKSMRNFRLVAEHQIVPPWNLPIMAIGNTFLHQHPEHSPKTQVSHTRISFPPCKPGTMSHQTLLLSNHGDTTVHFTTQGLPTSGLFAVKPATGTISPKSYQLLGLRFSPTDPKPAAGRLTIIFNNSAMNTTEVALHGTAHTPRLVFDPPAALFFRPTCLGAASQRPLTLHNPSRVPLAFVLHLPPKLVGILHAAPDSGILRGNESTQVLLTFTPAKQKVYDARISCSLYDAPAGPSAGLDVAALGQEGGPEELERISLQVTGEGTVGAISLEPASLDLGPVVVGYAVKRQVTMFNHSDGVLRYGIECSYGPAEGGEGEGEAAVECSASPLQVLDGARGDSDCWVEEPEGTLAARASKVITVWLLPQRRRPYSIQLQVRSSSINSLAPSPTLRPNSASLRPVTSASLPDPLARTSSAPAHAPVEVASPQPAIATITARAHFPQVVVTDVLRQGVSKAVLWEMLSVNDLNPELQSAVTRAEILLNKMADKGGLTTEAASAALRPFVLDFGLNAEGGDLAVVRVELSNQGQLPVAWELHSYDDPQLEMENWVQPGAPTTEEERHRDFIVENKVFDVQPRHGCLQPGSSGIVTFTYNPVAKGSHHWPIFFYAQDGKRVHLHLTGATVPPTTQHLNIPPALRTIPLPPTPLGTLDPPAAFYPIVNGGPAPLHYTLDTRPLAAATADNYNFPVLQLNSPPSGVIPPGATTLISWTFTPLEARLYTFHIPILLANNAIEVVTLQGRGVHPLQPPEDNPQPEPCEDGHWQLWPLFSSLPRISFPGQLASLAPDMLAMGSLLPRAVTRQLVVLTSTCQWPVAFQWNLGALDPAANTITSKLSLRPPTGVLEPGEKLAVELIWEAGAEPQIWEGDIRCSLQVEASALGSRITARGAAAEALPAASTSDNESEELLAEDPPRSTWKKGSLLRSRLPVSQSTTTTVRNKFPATKERYDQTLAAVAEQRLAATNRALPLPPPQIITLTIAGQVLTEAHFREGAFQPPWESRPATSTSDPTLHQWIPPAPPPPPQTRRSSSLLKPQQQWRRYCRTC